MLEENQINLLKYCYILHGLNEIDNYLFEHNYTLKIYHLTIQEIMDMIDDGYLWADKTTFNKIRKYKVTEKFVDEYMRE